MAAGIVVAVKPRLGAPVVGVWLCLIIVNLATMGAYLDVALRDLGLALCAFAIMAVGARVRAVKRRTPVTQQAKWFLRPLLVLTLTACLLSIAHRVFADGEQDAVAQNARRMTQEGARPSALTTFGDEAFWGDTLKLHGSSKAPVSAE